jgi:hypothetical protein
MSRRSCFLIALLLLGSCRRDMQDQPRYEAFEVNAAIGDSLATRPAPAGTVARGSLEQHTLISTEVAQPSGAFPFKITKAMIDRGEERFNIYCSPCHGMTGDGDGMVVRRGFKAPPSLHLERLRSADATHFFDVITNGFGVMPDYAYQLSAQDRWAVISYIRALQYMRRGVTDSVQTEVKPG